ncbi:MAG: DUF4118 domain-containing protein [Eubacteriales bacterium]|nr:DUF4118 domain-containing protein [Eubacteriales bacterium]
MKVLQKAKEVFLRRLRLHKRENWQGLLITTTVLIAYTALSLFLFHLSKQSGDIDVAALLMLAVMLITFWTDGYFWGILSSLIGVVLINTIFIQPYFELNFFMVGYPVTFFCLLMIAVLTGAMTGRNKKQMKEAYQREEMVQHTAEFSRKLIATSGYEETIRLILEHLYYQLGTRIVYLQDIESIERNKIVVFGEMDVILSLEQEKQAAEQCFRLGKETGYGTPFMPQVQLRYFPLISHGDMTGVIGILWEESLTKEQMLRVRFGLDWAALALERQRLEDQSKKIAMEAQRVTLRNDLLRSISHDLRTPLTGIIGATAAIIDNEKRMERESLLNLMHDINDDAVWLLQMTENLLSVSRLSTDHVPLKKQYEAVEELIAEAIARCKKRLPAAEIAVQVPEEPLFVPVDATLVVQVLINLIENGIRHGAPPVWIDVVKEKELAVFTVRDHGNGLTEEVKKTMFTGAGSKKPETGRGLGIGLSLCRSIIAAHGGTIDGDNVEEGGAQFRFTLPLEEEEDEVQ